MRAFEPLHSMLRAFVVLRVVIVSTLLLSAFLIQFTFSTSLPLNFIYYLAAFAYSISIVAILSLDRIPAETNAGVQLLGDLVVITGLVYVSGGPTRASRSSISSTVTAGSILLGRRGGLGDGGPRRRLLRRPRRPHVLRRREAGGDGASARGTSGVCRRSSETSRSTSPPSSPPRSSSPSRRTSCARRAPTWNAARPRSPGCSRFTGRS